MLDVALLLILGGLVAAAPSWKDVKRRRDEQRARVQADRLRREIAACERAQRAEIERCANVRDDLPTDTPPVPYYVPGIINWN